jgi:hypothetical protein
MFATIKAFLPAIHALCSFSKLKKSVSRALVCALLTALYYGSQLRWIDIISFFLAKKKTQADYALEREAAQRKIDIEEIIDSTAKSTTITRAKDAIKTNIATAIRVGLASEVLDKAEASDLITKMAATKTEQAQRQAKKATVEATSKAIHTRAECAETLAQEAEITADIAIALAKKSGNEAATEAAIIAKMYAVKAKSMATLIATTVIDPEDEHFIEFNAADLY